MFVVRTIHMINGIREMECESCGEVFIVGGPEHHNWILEDETVVCPTCGVVEYDWKIA
jgi:Zn finger protein HypA/HybF involved in hydrogenase expression